MEICLVRHAIAVERGAKGYRDDCARPLTPQGRSLMKKSANGLKTLFRPQVIVTSPVRRAMQTAEILEGVFGVPIVQLDALGSGDHAATIQHLSGPVGLRTVLVGHEPWMSELLSLLVAGEVGGVASVFKKGAAAFVTSDGPPQAGRCVLEWLVQPGALRRMS